MQPVNLVSSVESSFGALGYSVLQNQIGGGVKRMTLLLLRDTDGFAVKCLIMPAEILRGEF